MILDSANYKMSNYHYLETILIIKIIYLWAGA